jgi:hypothetical protein
MLRFAVALLVCCFSLNAQQLHPGARTVMDAQNCYPYSEWWGDRIILPRISMGRSLRRFIGVERRARTDNQNRHSTLA